MGELVHTARIKIVQKLRPLREAHIEGFPEPLRFGVHGGFEVAWSADIEEEWSRRTVSCM